MWQCRPTTYTWKRRIRGHVPTILINLKLKGHPPKNSKTFSLRSIPEWNSLPASVVEASRPETFKVQLAAWAWYPISIIQRMRTHLSATKLHGEACRLSQQEKTRQVTPHLPVSSRVLGWGKFVFQTLKLMDTFSQSGQRGSRPWPITQCPITRTWESAPKQWAVMAIVEEGSPTFETVLTGLIGCIHFLSVG